MTTDKQMANIIVGKTKGLLFSPSADLISRIFEKSRGLANVTKISGEKEGVGQPCQKEMI